MVFRLLLLGGLHLTWDRASVASIPQLEKYPSGRSSRKVKHAGSVLPKVRQRLVLRQPKCPLRDATSIHQLVARQVELRRSR
ncbi:hypothetical protein MTO96_009273 [Rhipicephalus appendiculatus]